MGNALTFEEYADNKKCSDSNLHRLDEMASISRPYDNIPKNSKIVVYGEYDDQGTKTPHFHVLINNGEIDLEIEFKHIRNMTIWRAKGKNQKNWDGITDVRDRIIEWFDEKPAKNYGITNLQRMIMSWNDANPTNEIDDKFVE